MNTIMESAHFFVLLILNYNYNPSKMDSIALDKSNGDAGNGIYVTTQRMSQFKKNKNRNEVEYCSLVLLQQAMMISSADHMMISSADHHDLSVVCQAQAYQIVTQKKKWTSAACWGGGVGAPIAPPSLRT